MTFWGIEVKPGKPFTLGCGELDGKLILTQATLGSGSSSKKSILQCNVGDASPVYFCTLLPDKSESCSLNLEFDEEQDVKFSVVGPTSIHLSGFVQGGFEDSDGEDYDSDSYGEDIVGTESEDSDYDSEEEDNFIDEDPTLYPPSVRNSGVVIEEIEDDEKAATKKGENKQTKKKSQLANSDNDKKAQQQIVVRGNSSTSVLESEDEDGFPVSSSHKSENGSENLEADAKREKTEEGKKKKKKNDAKDEGEGGKSLKRKVDAIDHDKEKSNTADVAIEDASEDKKKKKKKKKAKKENDEGATIAKQDASSNGKMDTADKGAKQSKPKPGKVRTFAIGLVIEELEMGRPDGKRASRGSKVSVHYIGKLQKTGKQFDANIGRRPFKFRLGVGVVIKGWDVGVEGMRVGDKRRLTIPPSMGYGTKGAPPAIPPNAWLVFDVELVDVA